MPLMSWASSMVTGLGAWRAPLYFAAVLLTLVALIALIAMVERGASTRRVVGTLVLALVLALVATTLCFASEGVPMLDPCDSCFKVWPAWVCHLIQGCA